MDRNYREALDAFRISFELRPKPVVLFNIAMCHKALKENAAAIEALERCLAEVRDNDSGARIRELSEKALAEIDGSVGRLVLEGTLGGAFLEISGKSPVPLPPKKTLPLDPGDYTLVVTKKSHQTFKASFRIRAGEKTMLTVQLRPLPARLSIGCGTDSARIFLDGKEMGRCPLEIETEPGRKELRIRSKTKMEYFETVTLKSGGVTKVRAVLKDAPVSHSVDIVGVGPATARTERNDNRLDRLFFWGSIAAGTLGLCAVGVGIGFGIEGQRDFKEGEEIKNTAPVSPDDRERFLEISRNELPDDRLGMILGYSIGGALLVTGAVFLVRSGQFDSRDKDPISYMPMGNGILLRF